MTITRSTYRSLQFFLLFLSFFVAQATTAQTSADTAAMVEQIFARYKPANPGAQVSVSRNGRIIFSKAWGMADLEHDITFTTNNVSEAGSVSKEFTAAAILLLEQEGKLSLNDDIRKYLPEIPDYGSVIRIRHLMHHTSGIKDWSYVADIGGWARGTKTYRNEDALEIIARQKTLNNKPGDEYVYSNSGYNLMAIIVQRVSGMSLAEFSKQYIFIPSGMTHTQWRDNFKRIVPGRAMAYEKVTAGYQTDMPNEYVYGNGGLLTTTEDLCKWVDYVAAAKLGGQAFLQKQIAVDTFNNGNPHYYAAGLRIQKKKGYNVIRHDGATASYRASLEYFPEAGLTIAGLCNTSEFDTSAYDVFSKIEDVFLAPKTIPVTAPVAVIVPPQILQSYTGIYRNSRSGEALIISKKEDKIVAGRTTLVPLSENNFKMGADLLHFTGKGIAYINSDKDTIDYPLVNAPAITPQLIASYTGNYFSTETNSPIRVVKEQGVIKIYLHPYQSYALKPLYKDGFTIEGFSAVLYFDRDKKQQITGFKISNARARNVAFVKQ